MFRFLKSTILFATLGLVSMSAFAASDSVAVFHRPEKVIVLVNESRSTGSRLSTLIDSLAPGQESLQLLSADGGVKIKCIRGDDESSCTFTFLPSPSVIIAGKTVSAQVALGAWSPIVEISFESSREDRFNFKNESGLLTMSASKRSQ